MQLELEVVIAKQSAASTKHLRPSSGWVFHIYCKMWSSVSDSPCRNPMFLPAFQSLQTGTHKTSLPRTHSMWFLVCAQGASRMWVVLWTSPDPQFTCTEGLGSRHVGYTSHNIILYMFMGSLMHLNLHFADQLLSLPWQQLKNPCTSLAGLATYCIYTTHQY